MEENQLGSDLFRQSRKLAFISRNFSWKLFCSLTEVRGRLIKKIIIHRPLSSRSIWDIARLRLVCSTFRFGGLIRSTGGLDYGKLKETACETI